MNIRKARPKDAEAIHKLIAEVAPTCQQDFGPNGLENFLSANTIENILERVKTKDYFSLLYEHDKHILGIITIKNHETINQLFVHPQYQKQGIAKELWQQAFSLIKANTQATEISVLSSSVGVPVYKSFGFKLSGDKSIADDITFYPMSLSLNKRS